MRHKKYTLADVARLANVSQATVSRALSQPEIVSSLVRARIEEVIQTLGYVPNSAARALASARTNVIGVLIPSITNNVFSDVLKGVYTAINHTPFEVQLGNTHYSVLEEEQLIKLFLSQRPAGLVVTGIDQSDTARKMLEAADCPIVQIMECGSDPVDMGVGFSQQDAAYTVVQHLVHQGYRKIAFLGARMDPRTQRRLSGYIDALRQNGLYDERQVITTSQPSTVALGGFLLGDVLSQIPDTDAVFCNNDDLALGVLFECQRRRIHVGEQLGICGFNDLEYMNVSFPPMSSVRTYRYDMGTKAIEMLLAAINGNPVQNRAVDIGFELMKRASSHRLKAAAV